MLITIFIKKHLQNLFCYVHAAVNEERMLNVSLISILCLYYALTLNKED